MKIFASDYDGTFIRRNPTPGELEGNIKQITRWREAGNLFIFATGRDMHDMLSILPKELVCDYLVCINGGIVAMCDGKIISEEIIPQHIADEIIAMINKMDIKNQWLRNVKENGLGSIAFEVETPAAALKIADSLAKKFEGKVTVVSNEQCVDIAAHGVTKATGIALIAKKYSIADGDVFCIGDSHNDLPMLSAYNGFTLPGVDGAVMAVANEVHCSVGGALRGLMDNYFL